MFQKASQGVVIALGVSLAAALAPNETVGAQALSPAEQELAVEEIVVTATRLADTIQELRRVPGQVYVITAKDIDRSKPSNVQEALRQVPSIVLYDQNGNRFQPLVDLRGFNAQPNPSISVFVDGVRVNEPDSNAVNFDLIPIEDVERIEILPGATAVFGQNALGGVINIITKQGTKTPQTTVDGVVGSYNHYRVSATTSGPLPKGFEYYLSFGLDRESGFRDFSDGRVSKLLGRVGYRPTDGTDLNVAYSYVNDRLEQAGVLSLAEISQDRRQAVSHGVYANELSSVVLHAKQKLAWGFSLAGNVSFRQTSAVQNNVGRASTSRLISDTNTTSGTLQLSHEGQFWQRQNRLSLGGEIQHSGVNSSGDGSFSGFPFSSRRLIDEDATGIFAQDSLDLTSQLTLTAAVRFDSTKIRFADELVGADSGAKWYGQTTPRAGLTYTPWSAITLYANYGQGFRVPTTDELFAFGPFGSNPNLKPVKSRTYEIGLRARPAQWLEGTLALFRADVRDEIVFEVTDPVTLTGSNINLPKSRRQGLEAGVKIRPHEWVDILLNYTYTDARFSTRFDLISGRVEKGDTVPLVPMHRGNGTVIFHPLRGLEMSLNGQYISRQVLLNDEPNQSYYRIQDAFVLNAQASYTWKVFRFFLQGNNLTGKKYETFGTLSGNTVFVMPAAGINVLGGLTIRYGNYY